MLREMSCSDFDDWFQEFQDEPFSWEINKFMLGQIAASVANSSGNYKDVASPSDFYPVIKPKKSQSTVAQLAVWRSM